MAMEGFRETIEWGLDGPLAEVGDLPHVVLFALVLVFGHSMGRGVRTALLDTMEPILGNARSGRFLFQNRLYFEGPPACAAVVSQDRVRLSFRQRVRPARLQKLLRALKELRGARDLHLTGQVQRFGERGESGGGMLDE